MATIGNFLIALLLFGLMVFVHELGHFLAARATGIGVKEFSIGLSRPAGFRRGYPYTLRLIYERILPFLGTGRQGPYDAYDRQRFGRGTCRADERRPSTWPSWSF